jgi:hypothetical protein
MEFRWISGIAVAPGDTLYVIDRGNPHLTVVSPEYHLVRTVPQPVVVAEYEYALLGDGSLVLNGIGHSTDAYGSPFHVVEPFGGAGLRSFGYDRRLITPRSERLAIARALAPSTTVPTQFWAAPRNRYVIERWDRDGTRDLVLERHPSWFEPYPDDVQATVGPDARPRPRLLSLAEDSTGLVWTFILVPDRRWRAGLARRSDESHGSYYDIADYHRYYDTRIEVIDPRTARLVASERVDDALRVRGSLISKLAETPAGSWYYDLFEYRLRRQP